MQIPGCGLRSPEVFVEAQPHRKGKWSRGPACICLGSQAVSGRRPLGAVCSLPTRGPPPPPAQAPGPALSGLLVRGTPTGGSLPRPATPFLGAPSRGAVRSHHRHGGGEGAVWVELCPTRGAGAGAEGLKVKPGHRAGRAFLRVCPHGEAPGPDPEGRLRGHARGPEPHTGPDLLGLR